jgi:hypothetical protein
MDLPNEPHAAHSRGSVLQVRYYQRLTSGWLCLDTRDSCYDALDLTRTQLGDAGEAGPVCISTGSVNEKISYGLDTQLPQEILAPYSYAGKSPDARGE